MSQNFDLESPAPSSDSEGWWRTPMMWLVVGGPALVIAASFVTLSLAISNPDPVLEEKVVANKATGAKALVPAREARNHAATGGQ